MQSRKQRAYTAATAANRGLYVAVAVTDREVYAAATAAAAAKDSSRKNIANILMMG
jgi:hypothetical protein